MALPKFYEKVISAQNVTEVRQSAAELWPKIDFIFKMTAVCRLGFLKLSYLVIRLPSSSKCAVVYQVSSKWMTFRSDMAI